MYLKGYWKDPTSFLYVYCKWYGHLIDLKNYPNVFYETRITVKFGRATKPFFFFLIATCPTKYAVRFSAVRDSSVDWTSHHFPQGQREGAKNAVQEQYGVALSVDRCWSTFFTHSRSIYVTFNADFWFTCSFWPCIELGHAGFKSTREKVFGNKVRISAKLRKICMPK
jgi:hypothetical protein